MLNKSSVGAAYPLAEKLATKGYAVRALDQTPLSELVNANLYSEQAVLNLPQSADVAVPEFSTRLHEASMAADQVGAHPHDQIMETSVDLVSKAVLFNLNLARNVVNPLIKQVVEQTQAYMDERAGSGLTPLTVVPYFYKKIWDSPILIEMVDRFNNSIVPDLKLRNLGLGCPDNLVELLQTGAGSFDAEIKEFADEVGYDTICGVWNSVFGARPGTSLAEVLPNPNQTNPDVAILVYLFARRLQDDVPAGISNMDLSEWRSYVSSIMAGAGVSINMQISRRQFDYKSRRLIKSMPMGDQPTGEIVVIGDVYNDWLREGGSPEILFGAAYSDGEKGFIALLNNKDQYLKVWNNTLIMLKNRAAYTAFGNMVEGLNQAMSRAIMELPEDQLAVDRSVLHQRLKERLTHAKSKDLENLWYLCRKAVCRVMFPHTDAEKLLMSIDEAGAANPEITDVREIALIGTIGYIATWISKLIQVEDVGA